MTSDDAALPTRIAWIDATAGIAGDMLLGALVDAGADLSQVQRVLDAVIPDSVRLSARTVERASQRATKVDVELLVASPPHRTWASIRELLETARRSVPARTVDLALAVFSRLAEAEGHAHGISPEDVHFHEVGALDSLADVIGACEAWRQLGIATAVGSTIAVGSGRIRAAHGDIPVPVPAVSHLALGWPTVAGELLPPRTHDHDHDHQHGDQDDHVAAHEAGGPHAGHHVPPGVAPGIGELATPTGVALLRGLAERHGAQPPMITEAVGLGAGTKDTPGRPNVVRVIVGRPLDAPAPSADAHDTPREAVQLEANVDDLDPRLWPGVLDALLDAGALDAWLIPIVMKRGRPAVTVHVLARTEAEARLADLVMELTGSLGVRMAPVHRAIRTRSFEEVELEGRRIRVKVARDDAGRVVRAEPEFRDVVAAARDLGVTEREALERARHAAGTIPR